jgi:hypothetical protein
VRAWFLDVESLLFWLQAVPLPEDLSSERHWRRVHDIINAYTKNAASRRTNIASCSSRARIEQAERE